MIEQRTPPQEIQVEAAIISTLIQMPSAYEIAGDILTPECFYKPEHFFIYSSIRSLANRNTPIDLFTIANELKMSGKLEKVGDVYGLSLLTNIPPIVDLSKHCHIIKDAYIKRELARICYDEGSKAYDPSISANDLMERLQNKISAINKGGEVIETMQDTCKEFMEDLDSKRAKAKEGKATGITSGFPEIDQKTNGWQAEDLITLAALSSMGKTAFALNLARNAALSEERTPVAFFSREMSKQKLMGRLVSMQSEILLADIRSGRITDEDYDKLIRKGIRQLEQAPIFLIPANGMTWNDVRRKCRQLKNKYGVQMIIDDYIQLGRDTDTKGKTREQILATISAENKQTAQSLKAVFFQLSQVDKKLEREQREPVISDLRESAAIGNDSDMVGFIYRPEYFGKTIDEHGASTKGVTYLKWAKFRDGEKDIKIKLRSDLSIQKFFSEDTGWKPDKKNADILFEDEKFMLK